MKPRDASSFVILSEVKNLCIARHRVSNPAETLRFTQGDNALLERLF